MAAVSSAAPTAGRVLELIRDGLVTTRADIASATGLSRTAVTARLVALLESGLVVEGEEGPSTGGRPPTALRFNAAAGAILAVALGRSRTQASVCDLGGRVLAGSEFDHDAGAGPAVTMPRVRALLEDLMAEAGVTPAQVRGLGLSLPGTVDQTKAMSFASPIMRGWDGVPLAPYFAGLTDVIRVENDAHALALSEMNGHLREFSNVLVLKASTGIGCGIVADGRLVQGGIGAAGDLGHIKTPAADGRLCRCGSLGCLEAIAGGWAITQEVQRTDAAVSHVRDVVAQALHGDAGARQRIRESGRRVGEVLAGAINLLNPEALIIGGDLAAVYDVYVSGLRETLYASASALAASHLEIRPSTHGAAAGIVGCAHVALVDVLSAAAIDRSFAQG